MRDTLKEQFKCGNQMANCKIKYLKKKYSEICTLNNLILNQILYTKYQLIVCIIIK